MRIRPVHMWWFGVTLFTPSVTIWTAILSLSIYRGTFHCPLDWQGIMAVYLPLFAALVGFIVPLLCLWLQRSAPWQVTTWAFAGYLAVLITWATIDVRHRNFQTCREDFSQGESWHFYYTWYFMPYRWIEIPVEAGNP